MLNKYTYDIAFLFCIILCIYCINYSIEKSRCKDIIKNNK